MTPVKVLIVDDSRTMRALLKHALDGDAAIEFPPVHQAAMPERYGQIRLLTWLSEFALRKIGSLS